MSIQTDEFSPGRQVMSRRARIAERRSDRTSPAPEGLTEYVGQVKAREQLEIFIGAAKDAQ